MKIFFHGNLESADDWKFLGADWKIFPLWEFLRASYRTWDEFSEAVLKDLPADIEHAAGYSLGGRILLNLVRHGLRARRLSFISTHPGLHTEADRIARIWSDLKWKEKVLTSTWSELFLEWNAQPALAPVIHAPKAELESDRIEIAHAFDLLSLGRMPTYPPTGPALRGSWICGENDTKFTELGRDFCWGKSLKFHVVPGAGHRIHKSHPEILREILLREV